MAKNSNMPYKEAVDTCYKNLMSAEGPYRQITLSVDPGLISGITVLAVRESDGALVSLLDAEMEWFPAARLIRELVEDDPEHGTNSCIDYVVCERFLITPQTGKNSQAGWSLEMIGVMKLATHMRDIPLTQQTPAAAKSFSTNDKLKRLDIWHVGGGGHANDAIRHGLLFHVQHGWSSPLLLSPEDQADV